MPRGGATAYCNRAVCHSVYLPRISRHSLKTKCWNLQHKQIEINIWTGLYWKKFDFKSSFTYDYLRVNGCTITSESMAVAGDLDSSEDKTVYSWLPYN